MAFTFKDEQHVRRLIREEVGQEVKTQLTNFRSEVFNKLDKIIGLMTKRDQEVTVLSKHSKQHTNKLDKHDKRLGKLESACFVS